MTSKSTKPLKIDIPAVDGFPLHAHAWVHEVVNGDELPQVVIINPATSVQSRYYSRFAEFLYTHGFNVITTTTAGLVARGQRTCVASGQLAGLGSKDFEGVLRFAGTCFRARHPDCRSQRRRFSGGNGAVQSGYQTGFHDGLAVCLLAGLRQAQALLPCTCAGTSSCRP
ncbi:MAG: hypothetical protein IPF44_02535 [Betaproteobacteria bacterium]|nr:hypothetical protein [Betaproteobacteria bacterium]